MGKRGIAFIFTRESLGDGRLSPQVKAAFGGTFIANEGFTKATAEAEIQSGKADAVAFGKSFIANPDLPRRLAEGAPLNEPKPALFFGSGPEGYTDYPAL